MKPVTILSPSAYSKLKAQKSENQIKGAVCGHFSVLKHLKETLGSPESPDSIERSIQRSKARGITIKEAEKFYRSSPLDQYQLIKDGENATVPDPTSRANTTKNVIFSDWDNYFSSESHENYQFLKNAIATAAQNHPLVKKVDKFLQAKVKERGDGAYQPGAPFLTLKLSEIQEFSSQETLNFKKHVSIDLVNQALSEHCEEERQDVVSTILREFEKHYHSFFDSEKNYAHHIHGQGKERVALPFPTITLLERPGMRDFLQEASKEKNKIFVVSSKPKNDLIKEVIKLSSPENFDDIRGATTVTHIEPHEEIEHEPEEFNSALMTVIKNRSTSAEGSIAQKMEESFRYSLRHDAKIEIAESKGQIFSHLLKDHSIGPEVELISGGDRISDMTALLEVPSKYKKHTGIFYNGEEYRKELTAAQKNIGFPIYHVTSKEEFLQTAQELKLIPPQRPDNDLLA